MEVLQRTANRGSISTGYEIDNSVKTEADNSEWMQRATGGGNDSNVKQHSISAWVKRTELGGTQMILSMANIGRVRFNSSNKIEYQFRAGRNFTTTRVFRDTSAWMHIFVVADTTLATASDRMKLYINGVRETVFDSYIAPDLNHNSPAWGVYNTYNLNFAGKSDDFYNGYIAETFFIGEQSLLPTDFGEFDDDSGIWKPKEYTGTFGSNDTYLDFKDSSNLGNNAAGGADLSLNNITAADQATDTPTNNFCTWNVLPLYNSNIFSFPNGATEVKRTAGTGWTTVYSSLGVNKGKWYAEFQVLTSGNYLFNGNVPLAKIQSVYATQFYLGSEASAAAGAGYYSSGTTGNDAIYHDATFTGSGVTTSAGDIISVAMDCDNNKIHFAVNGTYTNSSNPATNTNGFNMTDDYQFFAHATLTGDQVFKNNFGGYTTISISSAASDTNGYGTFEYAPPSGYYALCGKNLAEYGGTA